MAFLCFLATEEFDLDGAIEAGERALAATEPRPPQSALVEAALSLALAESGDSERAAVLAEKAHGRLEATGDDWSIAAVSLLRAQVAAPAGDMSTVAAMAAQAYRHADAIGFDAFQVSALLLEAWVAERRSEGAPRRRRISARSCLRVAQGLPTTLPSRWPGSAGTHTRAATCGGRRARAPGARRRGGGTVAVDRGARARPAGLRPGHRGRRRHRRGAVPRRARVVKQARPHTARESLFLALAEDPGAAARDGLDDLGQPHRETAAVTRARCSDVVAARPRG